MRTLGHLLAGRIAIALAIALAMLSAPTGSSAFHEAAMSGHVAMADLDAHGHGHSHDDDIDLVDEGSNEMPGDHHKHNAGDHSHEKPGVPPEFSASFANDMRTRYLPLVHATLPSLFSTLDRPPRPSEIA